MIKLNKREILNHLKVDYPDGTKVFGSVCEATLYLQSILKNYSYKYVKVSPSTSLCSYSMATTCKNTDYIFSVLDFEDAVVILIEAQKLVPFGITETIYDYSEWLSEEQYNKINKSNTLEAIL